MIWNETKECMSRDEMLTLQSARLVKQVNRGPGPQNLLNCGSVQRGVLGHCLAGAEDGGPRGRARERLPFLLKCCLLPFPSYPSVAKPLSCPLEWGSLLYCFLALNCTHSLKQNKPRKTKTAFPKQGLVLWIACRESVLLTFS